MTGPAGPAQSAQPPGRTWRDRAIAVRPVLPWMSAGCAALTAGSLSSRLLNPLPVSAFTTTDLTIGYALGAAASGGLAWLYVRWKDLPAHDQPATVAAPSPAASVVHDVPVQPETAAGPRIPDHAMARRVQEVLDHHFAAGTYYVGTDGFIIADNGECTAFILLSSAPSGFSESKARERIWQLVSESIPGKWSMASDTVADVLRWRVKAGFPQAVAMPLPTQIASSHEHALQLYKSFRLPLGIDADGRTLEIDPASFPHMVIVGGTGSGKSVFNRGLIEVYRSQGWMVVLGDGKGTDYTGLIGYNNIVAVGQTTADILRLVRMVADELRARQAHAKRTQREGGGGDPFRRPPIVLLLDEYATAKANIYGDYGKDHTLVEDLKFITRVGREFKVHLIIATQELYRDTIDGQILGNIQMRISLGPPHDKTIKEAFPEALRAEATRIGGTIDKDRDKGRAMALLSSDDGDNVVVEFQSFYGYSPGEPKLPPPALQAAHEQFRTTVSERITKLYPRLWFAVDDPDYGADVEHLYELPPVLLDDPNGQPDPAAYIYDPLRDEYLGSGEGSGPPPIPALTELQDGANFTPPTRTEPQPDALGYVGGDPGAGDELPDIDRCTPSPTPGTDYVATTAPEEPEEREDFAGDPSDGGGVAPHESPAVVVDEKLGPPWDIDDSQSPAPRPPAPPRPGYRNTGHVPL